MAPLGSCKERESYGKEGREVPSRVRLREGPIGVKVTPRPAYDESRYNSSGWASAHPPVLASFLVILPVPYRLFRFFQLSLGGVYLVQ